MRIAYITAGAAGMYCGSCLNDNALARALIRRGEEVALIPIYTPIRVDGDDASIDRVFYGAINVYLEQRWALFRRLPRSIRRWLDHPGLLGWATRGAASVDARVLGDLMLSVLAGELGHQHRELDELVTWLRDDYRPDVVHLPNSMLLGLARRIRAEVGVPVLCALQGEDIFLEELPESVRRRARERLVERARDVDGFTAPSRYYIDFMSEYLAVDPASIHRVPLGLDPFGHGPAATPLADEPFVVGYLARICPDKGLHLLADAFVQLAGEVGRQRVRLRIAGYVGERDRAYKRGVLEALRARGLEGSVEDAGEVDRDGKIAFLHSLHVLSVPTTYRDPKGLFVLEALANGVPVVLPRHGAFPEMVEATGGGLLVEPGATAALAAALRSLMDDPARRRELGLRGREAVLRGYTDDIAADALLKVYRRYVDNSRDDARSTA